MRLRYACVNCGGEIETGEVVYRCPRCSEESTTGFRKGTLLARCEPPAGVRRGQPVDPAAFLPLELGAAAALPVGGTPRARPARLLQEAGLPGLCFKLDYLNPSGSLKDRASVLVAAQALAHRERTVVLASTGNAGASMSCIGAACGLEVVLFVPATAPRAKLLQSLAHGARVVPIRGTYDQAFGLSIEYTKARGGINRNTAYNPLTIEGKKTVSIELYNQLGCAVPDVVYVPTGDGVILGGVYKGFADLVAAGLAPRLPVLVAVQAEGSAAIARSLREGREVVLERASTIADSISVESPANGEIAVRALRQSRGRAVEVSDAEITAAQAELARLGGLFVEPSSAAAWAGLRKDRALIETGARVVVLLTGSGFKDTAAAERSVRMPGPCEPTLAAALAALEGS